MHYNGYERKKTNIKVKQKTDFKSKEFYVNNIAQ